LELIYLATHLHLQQIHVYGSVSPDQQQRILDFWRRNNAIGNPQEAQQRVHQVVLIAEDENKQVVGVSTVYIQQYPGNMKHYFFYRMFIEPGSRVYGMMIFFTDKTYEFLRAYEMPNKPAGLVIITENRKLMRKGTSRALRRLGFEFIGKDQQQQDIWLGGFGE